jgi:hypothetical protein
MIYKLAVAAALVAQASAFAPALSPALTQPQQHRAAVAAVRMSGGTETVDFQEGAVRPQRDVVDDQMRPRPSIDWTNLRARLEVEFGMSDDELKKYDKIEKEDFSKAYEMMQLCRQFENACNQAYMQGNIRGFMHLDNGQEVRAKRPLLTACPPAPQRSANGTIKGHQSPETPRQQPASSAAAVATSSAASRRQQPGSSETGGGNPARVQQPGGRNQRVQRAAASRLAGRA